MMNTIKNGLFLFIKGYLNGVFPDYILKNRLATEIPVFIYHHIQANEFEARLRHLKRNGYTTLTADQLAAALQNRSAASEKSVVITFDDGLHDVYQVAYPLLLQYQMKAVVFLLPGWIGTPGVVTWDQVKEMHRSGVIDFQSHSAHHPAIFSSPKLIDFYNPLHQNVKPWNIPITQNEFGTDNMTPPVWGTPIYQFSSRFADDKRYHADSKLQQLCVDFVAQRGGAQFFNQSGWRKQLFAMIENFQKEGHYETQNEQIESILKELQQSKAAIENQLLGKVVRHFAWPWNQVGVLTAILLVECGYQTSFMGLSAGNIDTSAIKNLPLIRRVTGDFITCLPGEGRQSFWRVMASKITRRLKSGATY